MPNKQLGQHWLNDKTSLEFVIRAAGIGPEDTVLEIGPGKGSLTSLLLKKANKVIAVEVDPGLITELRNSFAGSNLEVIEADILKYQPPNLPSDFKVAANLPYYITAPILQKLIYGSNPPSAMGLIVQKEVAQRLSADAGDLSVLAICVQNRYKVKAGPIVAARLFLPAPKVDSQVIGLVKRPQPLFGQKEADIIKLVKAGFTNRRKSLVNSLHATLRLGKSELSSLIKSMGLKELVRAQELTLTEWRELHKKLYS